MTEKKITSHHDVADAATSEAVEMIKLPPKPDNKDLVRDNAREHSLTFLDVARRHPKIVWWSFFWCMCATGWGFDAQINGATVGVPAFRAYYGYYLNGDPVIPAPWLSAFNVMSSVGQFFGGFICSMISDKIGRKMSLAIGIAVATGGIFGETFSSSKVAFVISKFILGMGLGFYLTLAPLATSEIAPAVLRGLSTSGVNLGIGVGQLLSNGVLKGFSDRSDRWAFKGPFLIQLFFSGGLALGCIFAPESPWYLVRTNRIDVARATLQRLYNDEEEVEQKLTAIRLTIEAEAEESHASYKSAFNGTDRLRTLISMGVFACQHIVGIIFVLGYSTYFFQLAGLPTSKSFDLGVGVTACGVAGNICSWFVVNRFGRRLIFNLGMLSLTVILVLIGIMDVIHSGAAKWVQAALTVIYSFVYFLTLGAMAFALLGEVSSAALRARTTALATATQAVFGIVMNIAIPYMVDPSAANLKGKVGFIFGGMSTIAAVVCYFYIPELKGRTVNEIDTLFFRHVPPRKMGTYIIDETLSE